MTALLVWLSAAAAAAGLNGHRASKSDFKVLEEGVAGALKLKDVFPEGLERIDFVLYDAKYFYVYSQSAGYPFKKLRRWGAYQVYRVPNKGKVTEREWARCAGLGAAGATHDALRGKISEWAFECAPWSAFAAVQKKRRSIYQYKDGYLASIIHEYGHQYQEQQPGGLPAAVEINEVMTDVPENVNRDLALGEAFANCCELKGSRALYKDHYFRMVRQAEQPVRKDDVYGHDSGLRAAFTVLKRESGAK